MAHLCEQYLFRSPVKEQPQVEHTFVGATLRAFFRHLAHALAPSLRISLPHAHLIINFLLDATRHGEHIGPFCPAPSFTPQWHKRGTCLRFHHAAA